MNRNCFFACLGALLFSILTIILSASGAFTIPADLYDYSQIGYFIFISLGMIIMGFGFREIYREAEFKLGLIIFYIALIAGIFLIVFHAIIMPIFISIESYERGTSYLIIGGICYGVFSAFFITNGIFFLFKREELGRERLNLISGLLSLIFAIMFVVFVNILIGNYIHQFELKILDIALEQFLILILIFDPSAENIIVVALLIENAEEMLSSVNNSIGALEIVVKYVSLLPLGIAGFLNVMNFFILAKNDVS
ncbi:MAG: hypothetical protein HWN67_17085 [Candidatus Helarchaeota archaeon]|nr:hypothetical protein [Candidatus Helarchaeota archaeon]